MIDKLDPRTLPKMDLHIGPHLRIGFRHAVASRYDAETGIDFEMPRYHSRDDSDWPLQVDQNQCFHKPPSWHCCLTVTAQLLYVYHARPMKAEGTADQSINIRQVVQSQAKRYGVDPSDAMKHYDNCRLWLGTSAAQHPATLDALENNLRIRNKQRLH